MTLRVNSAKSTALTGAIVAVLAGCDGAQPLADPADDQAPPMTAVSVRIDAPHGTTPSASMQAFRGQPAFMSKQEVMAVVDPLLAAPPIEGCVLRAIDETASALADRKARVELEAVSNVTVSFDDQTPMRPNPYVYPDIAGIAAGIVGEAGPQDLGWAPEKLSLRFDGSPGAVEVGLPVVPGVYHADGTSLGEGDQLIVGQDQMISIEGVGDAEALFIELRPFGSTQWLACAPTQGQSTVVLPAASLQQLARAAGDVPVSLDVVWRGQQVLSGPYGQTQVDLSIEMRTSALVELTP